MKTISLAFILVITCMAFAACSSEHDLEKVRQLAKQGNADAQLKLSRYYALGKNVPQDLEKAEKWIRRAADQGDPQLQVTLGSMYRFGRGVQQNYKYAVYWYRRSAEQGYAGAQYDLAIMYANGLGVPQDYEKAAEWNAQAAEQGLPWAQYKLANMYFEGVGVPQSNLVAYALVELVKASNQNHTTLEDQIGEISKELIERLSSEEFTAAQMLSLQIQYSGSLDAIDQYLGSD